MMTKKNKLPYWKRRMLRIAKIRDAKDQEYIQKMVKEYDRLSNRIYKEIQDWMDRYADNEGITADEAYKQLTKSEQLTWTMTLKEFRQKAIDGGYDQELNREYFKSRITRLEQLERQLYFELAEAANHQETAMRTYLKDTLNETYLRHIYEMTDRGAFSIAFDRYSTRALELAIMKPWKGSNFSRRVWGNHLNYLPDKLSKTMSVAVSQGWGIDRTVKEMMQGVDSGLKNRMTTLVQTESAHIAEMANDHAMEQTGVKKWEWMATLEIHTCARCGGLDGQEFDSDDENAPNCPDHPNCRCTRVPVIAGWESASRWQRDPVTGKGKIGPNVSFEEWKESLEKHSGAVNKNSGALNKYSKKFNKFDAIGRDEEVAKRLYVQFSQRNEEDSYKKIGLAGGMSVDEGKQVFEHIFRKEHLFANGKTRMFDPDYDMAQSFSRIFNGKDIENHDIIMLKHELFESQIMAENPKIIYDEAHELTNKKYNYEDALKDFKKKGGG